MRTAFIKTITEMAQRDPRVTLVVGNLGFGVVTDFAERFPNQFLNAGVAEQNMTGVAAGMAMAGRVVFTYSIGNFPTLRCLEQIRNDVCYHKANVVVTAVGGGFAYGALGMSHHATEDLAILRSLPEIKVIAPGNPLEAAAAVRAVAAGIGPVYLRLGRAGETNVHQGPLSWTLGKAVALRDGADLTIISTGGMLLTAVQAADLLAKEGIAAGVLEHAYAQAAGQRSRAGRGAARRCWSRSKNTAFSAAWAARSPRSFARRTSRGCDSAASGSPRPSTRSWAIKSICVPATGWMPPRSAGACNNFWVEP